ncbi:related to component of the anaphase promoting complex [Sporisorium reilianum f. sp. reilianum]|uniref:Related to component of the anaphase promoting complex n=1 Tax=Sporisorium reilianum f. sp. reilianum TaxID=72559 RepID=A0A2N8U8F9_9BASI|nr:related to component of the anaphase promoting complex [Sporisorium reilianum f. sp. reilianum]
MSLIQVWQQALHSLNAAHDPQPATLPSSHAYSTLTRFLEPAAPSKCSFYDTKTDSFVLDAAASDALQSLLGSDVSVPSSSRMDLSSPNPILVALSNHYIDRCLRAVEQTALECGVATLDEHGASRSALGEDLPATLLNVSHWFRAWLSPYNEGCIFDGLPNHRDQLLEALQAHVRSSYFDRNAAEALRLHLEQLVVDHSDADLHATFVAHLRIAGLSGPALMLLTRVMHAEVSRKVRAVVDATDLRPQDSVLPLESAARPVLQQWLDDEVKPRFAAIRHLCLPHTDTDSARHDTWHHRLDYQLDKALCLTRAGQLFDLVALYPDSSAALEDLRLSLQNADQRLSVAKTLADSLHMRLLHPGAHTRDIIQMYVHLVRSLREMDPTGVVLSRVVSPLRRYLRARKDTVLVIVASMLGDDPDFTLLKDELERADQEEQEQEELVDNKRRRRPRRSLQTATAPTGAKAGSKRSAKQRRLPHARRGPTNASDSDASSDEDWDDPHWVPKPVEAGSAYRMSTSKDIISMLTSIFDDRSGFIGALEKSMADQLVHVKGYKAMNEYRNNMILKKWFGEKNMGRCDVMLGDVTESRRIDSEVHQQRRVGAPSAVEGMVSRLHPLIVSRQFWPESTIRPGTREGATTTAAPTAATSGSVEFTLPPLFRHAQDEYAQTYSRSKAMRKLHWLNHLGSVQLDIELDSGDTIATECSLLQASTLEVISRCNATRAPAPRAAPNVVTLTDVMEELNLQREKDARDALEFWVATRLLKPVDGLADAFLVQTALPAQEVEEDEGHEEPL